MESSIFIYLLKANVTLAVLYFIFLGLFQRTTFHLTNRVVLLFIMVFSVSAPFISYSFYSSSQNTLVFVNLLGDIHDFTVAWPEAEELNAQDKMFSYFPYLLSVYLLGVFIMTFRFVAQLRRIFRLKRESTPVKKVRNLFLNTGNQLPFTFMNWIFMSNKTYYSAEMQIILQHEQVHVRQKHSIDNIFAELICIVFWFNPLAYMLKRSFKVVHEYLADSKLTSHYAEREFYLKALIKGINYLPAEGVLSNFYFSTIKKRINMIARKKTSKLRSIAYLLFVPLLAILIQSFSGRNINNNVLPLLEKTSSNEKPEIMPIAKENVKRISSGYGMRIHPIFKEERMHHGIDIVAAIGTPVLATANGTVVKVEFKEEKKGYGRLVLVQHGNSYVTLYSQLSAFKVEVGDKVQQGDVVGLVGSSGYSTGPHLHYEVHKNGERVNPELYFE